MRVVGLGAECDVDDANSDGSRASFRVSEFAVLDDGSRITLHAERGFVSKPSSGDPWRQLSLDDLGRSVRTTVLPDGEPTDDEHPWEWLVELLDAHGITTTADELRRVPYDVVFTDRVIERIPRAS